MSKRLETRQHLWGVLAWSIAGCAGLWPALPGVGDIGTGHIPSFVELVALSDGRLGGVALLGLVGALAALLHLLAALDLWIDGRALRTGGLQGNWRATRFGLAASLAFVTLAASCWTGYHDLRVDNRGTYIAQLDDYASRAPEAWSQLLAAFRAARPTAGVHLPPLGADPLPMLREIDRSPAVSEPFYISPTGQLTLLDAHRPLQLDLTTWQPPSTGPVWPRFGPQEPFPSGRDVHDGPLRTIAHVLKYERANLPHGTPDFKELSVILSDETIVVKGSRSSGYLGYEVSERFIRSRGQTILRALDLPGYWAVGRLDPNAYVLPRPAGDYYSGVALRTVHLVISPYNLQWAQHLQTTVTLLAALGLLFFASVVEAIRQFRALIAERAMQLAQSSFVSGVSHEMRTPLATVRLYTELLEQGLDKTPADRGEFTRAILFEVDRLHRLIENVLDFARISGRKRTYGFVPTDLRGVIDEALQAAKGPLAAAGLQCEVHLPVPLTISLDRDAIVQALANMLSNAAKYAAAGGRVWIGALPEPQGVVLTVQDFGPGIPRHEQAKVFQPFYRVAGQAAGGTGLGLALVQEYARAHGGHVTLESPPGQGATFSLHLPEDPTLAPAPTGGARWRALLAALFTRRQPGGSRAA